jgi:hypothetical protein
VERVPHQIETPPGSAIIEQVRLNAPWRALKKPHGALKSFEIRLVGSLSVAS